MKVRAKEDGHYGGYYRVGPHLDENEQMVEGEIFEIDATPHPIRDEQGNPIQEMMQTGELSASGQPVLTPVWEKDANGKLKKDAKGKLIPVYRMATFFSPEWMEPVNDDATIDYPFQSEPLGVLPQMMPTAKQQVKRVAGRPVKLPDDIAAVVAGVRSGAVKVESPI